jgi:hypothetical protein
MPEWNQFSLQKQAGRTPEALPQLAGSIDAFKVSIHQNPAGLGTTAPV